jgi:hypothetical protein
MILSLNVQFNQNAMKNINEVCKCDSIEGLQMAGDEIISDSKGFKPQAASGGNMNSYKSGNVNSSITRPSLVLDEENDLLSDMSFTAIDHNSPFK